MALDKDKSRARYVDFIGIERRVADSEAFISLSALARALYVDLRRQFNGRNNGDICAADYFLKPYGWAHSSIHKGLKELLAHGLIEKTRQGGIGAMSRTPSLYAFTDLPVMANPQKGIKGAQPSLAYRQFPLLAAPTPGKQIEGAARERSGTNAELMKVSTVTA